MKKLIPDILFLSTCLFLSCLNIVKVNCLGTYKAPTITMEENCGKVINVGNKSITLQLKSANKITPAQENECLVKFRSAEGWKLRLNITKLGFPTKVFPSEDDITEYLMIEHPDGTNLNENNCQIFGDFDIEADQKPGFHVHWVPACGSLKDYYAPEDGQGFGVYYHGTDNSTSTFTAIITAFEDGGCHHTDGKFFRCSNQRCLDKHLALDKVDNCGDSSDVSYYNNEKETEGNTSAILIVVGIIIGSILLSVGGTFLIKYLVRRRRAQKNDYRYQSQVNI